ILVLMEDTLGVCAANYEKNVVERLNSCFNGRYSRRIPAANIGIAAMS
ncbi:hypothetical protein HMPREF9148_01148, partial [Prevotella sp. F0091]